MIEQVMKAYSLLTDPLGQILLLRQFDTTGPPLISVELLLFCPYVQGRSSPLQ